MPQISVIIPAYNAEKTIKETIESVLKQTFTDFELIIINDGSQDLTLEIANSIRDHRIKVFSYANAGVATSRNRGIEKASGEYIAFLDADDLWTADKLQAQFQALQDNSKAAVAYSWTQCIDESGNFLRHGSQISVSGNVYTNLLLFNFLENGSNPLIRREALMKIGSFNQSLSPSEDWDMWQRLAAQYQFVAISELQILYRISPSSCSANFSLTEKQAVKIIDHAFSQVPTSLQHLKRPSLANIYKYLTFRVLEGYDLKRSRGLTALRFLWYALINDNSLLKTKVIWKVLLKITLIVLLPYRSAQVVLTNQKKLFNVNALLMHTQRNPL